MKWYVLNYDFNAKRIENFNIFQSVRFSKGIDELRNKFLTLGSGIREGTADIGNAVKELNTLTNQADKLGKSLEKFY